MEKTGMLDGNHGLIGEGFEQLDLRRGEETNSGSTCDQRSNEFPLLTKGNEQDGTPVAVGTHRREIILCRADVGNVESAVLSHPAIPWLINTDLDAAHWYGYGTKMSPHDHSVTFAESE